MAEPADFMTVAEVASILKLNQADSPELGLTSNSTLDPLSSPLICLFTTSTNGLFWPP
jgi:hypothetical protein